MVVEWTGETVAVVVVVGGVGSARVVSGGGYEWLFFFFLFSFFCLAIYSSFSFFSELAIASNFLF